MVSLCHASKQTTLGVAATELTGPNKFCRTTVRQEWVGKSFFDVFVELKRDKNVILVAVMDKNGKTRINPTEYTLREGDALVAIASHDFEF